MAFHESTIRWHDSVLRESRTRTIAGKVTNEVGDMLHDIACQYGISVSSAVNQAVTIFLNINGIGTDNQGNKGKPKSTRLYFVDHSDCWRIPAK